MLPNQQFTGTLDSPGERVSRALAVERAWDLDGLLAMGPNRALASLGSGLSLEWGAIAGSNRRHGASEGGSPPGAGRANQGYCRSKAAFSSAGVVLFIVSTAPFWGLT